MNSRLCLFVDVPICAFRPYESREYQDTHPCPPPSSVYGMLLSLCGVPREEKAKHYGAAIALALQSSPGRSKVFRKLRRGKELGDLRPDYQDILIGLRLWIWLTAGHDEAVPPLSACVANALDHPKTVNRSGGLSLGESSYLVDSIVLNRDPPNELLFLKPDPEGFYNLPVWVDHAANTNIRRRFNLETLPVAEGLRACWFHIGEAS
jgi:CRISPR-associated protein Cas5t